MQKRKIKDTILLSVTAAALFICPISFYLTATFESIIPDLLFFGSCGWLMSFWWSNSGLREKDRK